MSGLDSSFCESQMKSHSELRISDPDFYEYHRGAETAYAVLLMQISRLEEKEKIKCQD